MKTWSGKAPTHCQLCKQPIGNSFIDGATRMGPWAYMCENCHSMHGNGLGTGRGQMYEKRVGDVGAKAGLQGETHWVKTKG